VLDAPGVAAFVGRGDLPYDLADEMHRVWTHFIQGDSPGWSSYSASDRIAMHFDTESSLVSADHAAAIALWAGIR
jgi:carboxylesterase type B